MSISSSLVNALSGLNAAARLADVVASNTANAMTQGYARRELSLSSKSLGGDGAGVRIDGVNRVTNAVVQRDLRLANSSAEGASVRASFYARIETALGLPEDASSLSAKLANFESALIEAGSRPDSKSRLNSVLQAAQEITNHLNTTAKSLENIRREADQKISNQVDTLNQSLVSIDELNAMILAQRSAGRDATALMDQRDVLIDRISNIVPVRAEPRDHDQIALYTAGGAILLEGTPATIGFNAAGFISADMSLDSGLLSGLTLNGRPISSKDTGVLGGGSLGALFQVRDELAPEAQTQIDAFARDLIGRFADPAVDPTLGIGDAGLFTDNGAAFDSANELGLAGRISVSSLVDPAQGGALWRLRDGLGAATTGEPGNASLLMSMASRLEAPQLPASGSFSNGPNSTADLAADMLSQISGRRIFAEETQIYRTGQQGALHEMALMDGVDTDYEMQMLLQVEQVYAANARVIQTIDALLTQMLEL